MDRGRSVDVDGTVPPVRPNHTKEVECYCRINTARACVLRAGYWPDALKRNVRFLKRIGAAFVC